MINLNRSKGWRNLCRVLGLGMVLGWSFPAQAGDGGNKCYQRNDAFNVVLENDQWGSGYDKHYTHGHRLSFLESREEVKDPKSCTPEQREKESGGLDFIRNALTSLLGEDATFKPDQISLILGQNFFTPQNIAATRLISNDRPYAGWLYFGIAVSHVRQDKTVPTLDTVELDLGIVGPESYAGDIQVWWHDTVNGPPVNGWDNQLKNEPGIMVNLERKWRLEVTPHDYRGLQVDLLPSVGAALGNVHTFAAAGAMLRLGLNLSGDYGPPRIRPGLQGSDYFRTPKDKSIFWYGYVGVQGRAVAANIFLDGNTFTDSHSVDKKYFVGDLQAGFVLAIYDFRMSVSQVYRSKEFDGQDKSDQFGAVNLSLAW